jgi:hypothetical protein
LKDVLRPNKVLERKLLTAIKRSLHELLPDFRTHMGDCPGCGSFHDWMTWNHVEGTNEWVAHCPESGQALTLPFVFGPKSE